jgi:anthranilate phosphoribosyltransferase
MINFIKKLESNENLSFEESKSLFLNIMEGKYEEENIINIINSLVNKC